MHRLPVTLVALLLLTPAEARAQADWLVMPYFGLKFAGSTAFFDLEQAEGEIKNVFGGSAAWLGSGVIGVEADFAFIPGYFERKNVEPFWTSSYVLSFGGNAILTMPLSVTREGLRPYLVGGFGLLRASADDILGTNPIDSVMPAITFGGGALGMLSASAGVRFDLRYQRSVGTGEDLLAQEGSRLTLFRASVAYVRRF